MVCTKTLYNELQNGFISQEEYDDLIEQANEYATIVEWGMDLIWRKK